MIADFTNFATFVIFCNNVLTNKIIFATNDIKIFTILSPMPDLHKLSSLKELEASLSLPHFMSLANFVNFYLAQF